MTISPAILIGGLVPPVDVSAGATVNGALASTAGVRFFAVTVTACDELNTVAALQATLSVNQSAKTFSLTAPGSTGSAVIVRVQVGINGLMLDANSQYQASFAQTFKINVTTGAGLRVVAVGELTEQDPAFGSVSITNQAARNAGGGGGGAVGGQFNLTLANGRNDNLSTTGLTLGLIGGPTAAFAISGIASTASSKAGLPIVLVNTTAFQMSILSEDTNSSAANRIRCDTPNGGPLVCKPNGGSVTLWYDNTVSSRWYAISRGWETQSPRNYDIREAGAICDCQFTAQVGQITTGTNSLTLSSGAPFVAGDVGKHITVTGAGAAGADLHTTIAGFSSSSHVTLTANAGTTVPNAAAFPPVQKGWVIWGTDDSTAWSTAITAAAAGATVGVLLVHAPSYLVSQQTLPANVALECEEGAVIHSETTLNVRGRIKAHETQQIFSMPTQVSLLNQTSGPWTAPVTTVAHSGWWGAVGDNATDNTVALRSGLAAAGTMGNVSLGGVGGTFQFGFGWYLITDSLTVSQFATGVTALEILGHGKGASGGSTNTVLVMNFAERQGTAASLSSGVLTTGGGDPAWQASDVGTWVYLKNGQAMGLGTSVTPGSRPAVTCSQAISSAHQIKVRVLRGGAQGVATFQARTETSGWSSFTTSATPTSFLGFTITTPAGTYVGNLDLIATGGGAPAVSLSSALNSTLEFSIIVSTSGTLPSAAVQISTDNGNTYAAPQAIASGSIVVTLPQGTVTITFPAGTYTAGTHSWATASPHSWFFHTNIGAWRISAFGSATSVTVTDPSGQFNPVDESGLNWAHPTRTGLRIWSRDCKVKGVAVLPANNTYCYASVEDAQGDASVSCSNNQFEDIYITVLGAGASSCLIHGFSHADNPATPGRNANAPDCENNRYIGCYVSLVAFSGFYNPNTSGQSKETVFDKTHFFGAGQGNRNLRCCVYNFSGSFTATNGCNWSTARTMIYPGISDPITVDSVGSEQCDRLMYQPNQSNAAQAYSFFGGRSDPTSIAEDGCAFVLGQGIRLNLFGFAIDPEIVPNWKVFVQNSGSVKACVTAHGCIFPCGQPLKHPVLLSGEHLGVSYINCCGTDESGNLIDTPDVVSQTYGS